MYRSPADEPPPSDLVVTQHGQLTVEGMLALLQPGKLDPSTIVGRRVRWAWSTTRRQVVEGKIVAEQLKQLHLQLGAAEVVIFRGPWLKDPSE